MYKLILALIAISNIIGVKCELNRVCYLIADNTSYDNIISDLCTHVIVGFATVRDGIIAPISDYESVFYRQVIGLKKTNPSLKVMLSVGGSNNDYGFHNVCRDQFAIDMYVWHFNLF
jgi:GH18 family chitinase